MAPLEYPPYSEFARLCHTHGAVFDPYHSPDDKGAERVISAVLAALERTAYVQTYLVRSPFYQIVNQLESRFSKQTDQAVSLSNVSARATSASKVMERRLRFMRRLVTILGPFCQGPEAFTGQSALKTLNEARQSMDALQKHLDRLVTDDLFMANFPRHKLQTLSELYFILNDSPSFLAVQPAASPSQRRRDIAAARDRVLADRLAEACLAIYNSCRPSDIEGLRQCCVRLDSGELDDRQLQALIDAARKRWLSGDEWEPQLGDLFQLHSLWVPARMASPPWWGLEEDEDVDPV